MVSASYGRGMRYRVLGPVRIERDGEEIPLGGPQQRLVLALLIAARGRVVSSGGLIEAMWGDDAPPTAKKTVQGYISKLRAELGDALATQGSGYSLATADAVDAIEFENLRRRGQELMEVDPTAAASTFREALALWDGPAFADLVDHLALAPDITRLEDLRIAVLGDRIDADLACGGHRGLIGELDGLTQEFPLHDRFRGQHMLALYRAGRQVEALRSFERTWFDIACDAVGRNMTRAEWEQFGPRDTEYRATCPQYDIEA
jgi:DNA-binding SARP family transcriptional activator